MYCHHCTMSISLLPLNELIKLTTTLDTPIATPWMPCHDMRMWPGSSNGSSMHQLADFCPHCGYGFYATMFGAYIIGWAVSSKLANRLFLLYNNILSYKFKIDFVYRIKQSYYFLVCTLNPSVLLDLLNPCRRQINFSLPFAPSFYHPFLIDNQSTKFNLYRKYYREIMEQWTYLNNLQIEEFFRSL